MLLPTLAVPKGTRFELEPETWGGLSVEDDEEVVESAAIRWAVATSAAKRRRSCTTPWRRAVRDSILPARRVIGPGRSGTGVRGGT